MCFLYRQSISIVYESKFKYIYRYFIKIDRCFCEILQSLPLRKCGLKYESLFCFLLFPCHFPCGSVDWNFCLVFNDNIFYVTSLAEVWIEIFLLHHNTCQTVSLPLRKCGLKSLICISIIIFILVTSLAEVWIEICYIHFHHSGMQRHFPCGSVDWNA